MSGSISSTSGTGAGTGATGTGSSADALKSLTSNYSTFLQLLLTQLQNQDPSSPMDTSTFTTELVQFSGVEQQINTNSSLSTLIQLQQGSQTVQAISMVGKSITATSTQLAVQGGTPTAMNFTAPAAGKVGIIISDSIGDQLYATTVNAGAGNNTWHWSGKNNAGTTLPDGDYTATVTTTGSDGSATTLPFTITGTATGVAQSGNTVQLDVDGLPIALSSITAVQ